MHLFKVLLAIATFSFISSEKCEDFETCGQCIGNTLHCAWCSEALHNGPRCVSSGNSTSSKAWCSAKYKYDPVVKENEETDMESQLQPSRVDIKARPGDNVTINMFYKPKKDHPIDVYYLFDNSWTMRHYKTKLCDQAKAIHDALKKNSNNVRFGAGSFVEKLALPLASEEHGHMLNTFNNHLSLTSQIEKFVKAIERVNYTSNLDDPEAALDALMQAMVCKSEINWREGARRIIILSTDESYHSAGDGRAVGAFKPNDMKCHLKKIEEEDAISSHVYTKEESLEYDYPSVSQINHMAKENDFSIFFVATEKVKSEYQALVKAIVGAKFVELKDKSDLVEIITTEYLSITNNLELSPPEEPSHLHLNLDPNCKKNDSRCIITHGGGVNITASLYVRSCPTDNKYNHTLTIKPAGLSDSTVIHVEVQCQCPCEGKVVKNKTMCGDYGVYQCGVCKCDTNWYGKTCQCAGGSTEKNDLRKCKSKDGGKPCSGRGNCSCGVCECRIGYDGAHCEYRTDDCPTHNDNVCSGEDHGECKLGKCQCKPLWEGVDCSCSKKTDSCVGANTQICSGNGYCQCGSCVCTNDKFKGAYCDLCDTCSEERCEKLKDYTICNYDGVKVGNKETCDKKHEIKNNITVELKNQTEIDEWSEGFYCKIILPDDSSIVYKYLDGNNFTMLWIQKDKELPPERNIWIPIGSAIGAILLIGILTLIAWKILVDIHDAREYRKFAAEAEQSGFEVMENPLYKQAAVSINNPAYNHNRSE